MFNIQREYAACLTINLTITSDSKIEVLRIMLRAITKTQRCNMFCHIFQFTVVVVLH